MIVCWLLFIWFKIYMTYAHVCDDETCWAGFHFSKFKTMQAWQACAFELRSSAPHTVRATPEQEQQTTAQQHKGLPSAPPCCLPSPECPSSLLPSSPYYLRLVLLQVSVCLLLPPLAICPHSLPFFALLGGASHPSCTGHRFCPAQDNLWCPAQVERMMLLRRTVMIAILSRTSVVSCAG